MLDGLNDHTFTRLKKTIIESRMAEINIKNITFKDTLTGLPEKILFCDRLKQAIPEAHRTGKILAVIYLGLDGFQELSRDMGAADGDTVLTETAKRLLNAIRRSDTAARVGDSRFLILIQGLNNIMEAETIIQRITDAFKLPFCLEKQILNISVSVGCSFYPVDGENEHDLICSSEAAMLRARKSNGNSMAFCNASTRVDLLKELKLTNRLYQALELDELELYYQPQIDFGTQKIVGIEALLRWNLPGVGMLYPNTFVPIAEKNGLIVPIGQWVLETACSQHKKWQEQFQIECPVSVNISAVQFDNADLEKEIISIINKMGLEAKYLHLEVTEDLLILEMDRVSKLLERLKALGVSIVLDDFGTFYSSLSCLKKMPVDVLKIDKSFIDGIGENIKDEAIVKTLISLTRNLGLKLVAEGVETKLQAEFLMREGCPVIQGYYFYKPMPAKELERLFEKTERS